MTEAELLEIQKRISSALSSARHLETSQDWALYVRKDSIEPWEELCHGATHQEAAFRCALLRTVGWEVKMERYCPRP